jgi:beta-glucosidase
MMENLSSFLWGAATSSYQVEGGSTNNDWDFFTRSEAIKERVFKITKPSIFYRAIRQLALEPAGDAVKCWEPEYYTQDFQNAYSLGMNAFRISIEWARIEPEKGQWNQDAINHYKQMIISMKDNHLKPIISLNHVTLPLWVLTPPTSFKKRVNQMLLPSPLRDLPYGEPPSEDPYWKSLRGWENYKTVDAFIKFIRKVAQELKDKVDFWITLGEPVASIVGLGYLSGIWPPGFFLDGDRAKMALHNLIEAHVKAYDVITDTDDVDADGDRFSKMVGVSHAMTEVQPASPNKWFGIVVSDNIESSNNFSYFINDYFLNAVVNGEEDLNYLNTLERYNKHSSNFLVHSNWTNKIDFIGLNYYRRLRVKSSIIVSLSSARFMGGVPINDLSLDNKQPHGFLNDLGWEIYPKGLHDLVIHIQNRWKKPILITENGIADRYDRYRAPFIVAHLQQIKQAIDEGANVMGYLHWSMLDNYEWQEGYRHEAKFGLCQVDRNLNRKITDGAQALNLIIRESIARNWPNSPNTITDDALSKAIQKYGTFTPDGIAIVHGQETK